MSAADTAFKDLCLDVNAAEGMSRFWSAALGLQSAPRGHNYVLTDAISEHTLWLNEVPELKTVKHRVHPDLHVGQVEELVRLGATVTDDSQPWTVLADPEGGELCAFVRPPERLPDYRMYELVVDASDPERIARWWADRFGAEPETEAGENSWSISGGAGPPWEMVFTPVPEPKVIKNRVHWDVFGDTPSLVQRGARLLRARDDEIDWDVLADPEGNEFCVFTRS